ncbi:MAG: ABC transporter permease [marine bacterium B5-7]|nr:MAG: ABC transporter permease [marine bacterium B5-7]
MKLSLRLRLKRWHYRGGLMTIFSIAIFIFLCIPLIVALIMSVNPEATLGYPKGFSLKWFGVLLNDESWMGAYRVSIQSAFLAALLALVNGTLFAFANSRFKYRLKGPLATLALSPLGVPGIVLGVGLLLMLNPLSINGTMSALVIAFTVITVPYVVRTVGATLAVYDRSVEEAALTLGANEIETFFRITLPMIAPGLLSATILAFVFAFGNLQVAIFLTGIDTVTVPVLMYSVLEFEANPTIAAAAVLNIAIVTVALVIGTRMVGARNLLRF